ncbi:MAG: SUMF1/EgtB/PvdO family nonheme iron enzyme, partial [Verrucomicrobiota bacterium]
SSGYGAVGYAYRMGKYEVTASQWATVIAADSRVGNAGSWAGDQPTASANWYEAAKFCNWLTTGDAYTGVYQFDGSGVFQGIDRSYTNGNGIAYVLPSENEWYKAAYYKSVNDGSYSLYANGSDATPPDVYTADQTGWNYDGSSTTNMGVWAVGGSVEEQNGTYDMMGNVWEWTEEAEANGNGNFWGGSHRSGVSALQSGAPAGTDPPELQHSAIGFRVAAIPEPGTISLMGLSTIGLFFTRNLRRRKLAGKSIFPVRKEHFCDTFSSLEEWESAQNKEPEANHLPGLAQQARAWMLPVWNGVYARYKALDKTFWNHMVARHEHRVARRKAFKKALKKKALDCFDVVLSLIMK